MKDFDVARGRKETDFLIGGEEFRVLAVSPETLLEHQEMEVDPEKLLPQIDAFVLASIDDTVGGGHARWKALRARKTDQITLGDLQAVMQWLIEWQSGALAEETGRPTEQPSSSGPGLARTGTRSTGVSSSRASRAA